MDSSTTPTTPTADSTAMLTAFDLPEVRQELARYLIPRDLLNCILVSQTWALHFRPSLWHTISFNQKMHYTLTKELVHKYGGLIRKLIIHDPVPLLTDWFLTCQSLVEIDFTPVLSQRRKMLATPVLHNLRALLSQYPHAPEQSGEREFLRMEAIDKLLQLVERNPFLRALKEDWKALSATHAEVFHSRWMTFPNSLVNVHLKSWHCSFQDIETLLVHSPQLRHLTLMLCVIQGQPSPEFDPASVEYTLTLPKIQSLNLYACKTVHISAFEVHAPELTKLHLRAVEISLGRPRDGTRTQSDFLSSVTWRCPSLSTVIFSQDKGDPCPAIIRILGAAECLKSVALTASRLNAAVMEDLVHRHGSSLETVNLMGSSQVPSASIQKLLASCPNLIRFWGPKDHLGLEDLSASGWVCGQLEVLVVRLGAGAGAGEEGVEDEEYYGVVYDQLTHLSRLRLLGLGAMGGARPRDDFWRVSSGLFKLTGLKQMETVWMIGHPQEMDTVEEEWMKTHWPRLRNIRRTDTNTILEAHHSASVHLD